MTPNDFSAPISNPTLLVGGKPAAGRRHDRSLAGVGRCAVIGAGYTGLHAAIETARAGLDTVVIDAEAAGWGCSTRNGGQISTSVKPSFATLKKRDMAKPWRSPPEGRPGVTRSCGRFVRDEKIDCDFAVVGRFHGAHTPDSMTSWRATARSAIRVSRPAPIWSRSRIRQANWAPGPITAAPCFPATRALIPANTTPGFGRRAQGRV
jgi:glycine/D-amino acid oxidase-like deaminating enzyme